MQEKKYYNSNKDDYFISTDPSLLKVDIIYNYLPEESYWAKNIPKDVIVRSIANSLRLGIYHQDKQIGFARLVTDKATIAYLADVFIISEYRGKVLS